MTASSLPLAAPVAAASAAPAPDVALPGPDFLAVLAGIGALQWAPATAVAAGPLQDEASAADAPPGDEPAAPEAIVTAIAQLLAPPGEPLAAAPAIGAEAQLPALERELPQRWATFDAAGLEVLSRRDAAEHSRAAGPDAPAAAGVTDSSAGRPALDHAETRPAATSQVPVGHPRWAEAVGHEVRLLIDRGLQAATLRLSPEQLGPLEVRIEVADDRAQVWFGAAHAETRAALADAMPRLREMFEAAGLQLTDAGVHREAPRDPQAPPTTQPGHPGDPGEDSAAAVSLARLAAGLVDEYA